MSRFLRRFRKEATPEKALPKDEQGGPEPRPPEEPPKEPNPPSQPKPPHQQQQAAPPQPEEEDEPAEETEETRPPPLDEYNPSAYADLQVGPQVAEVFSLIPQYEPHQIELETLFTPFIPEYIPAIGDVDAFIKIPRPDDIEDELGLATLDEPSLRQTDPTVLGLQLRNLTKSSVPKGTVVKRVGRADQNEREVDNWIRSISELHRSQPATSVHYAKPMPDIDTLMQEWPTDIEELLKNAELPSAEMDMSLNQYIDTICAILDIPVYKNRVQSLHVLFSLYSEFKNSQHFMQDASGPPPPEPQRLEIGD